ncbi:MAG: SET domain-containing protein-lysine N-methyltransferase [Candidatus Synoicihabitans palmerolidicus]|nr:SET domain-containing protein-lysine N-methyltransferase [Candidatus Synoicihabitans palmerolidicus]MCC5022139.1 SET domain-containing protein-lysine N-methyltransferase [Candidatus Synoicihabitans palmerolidicus]
MTSPWVRLAASAVHGTGLYATKAIAEGTRVIEYVGEKITKAESDRRDKARQERQEGGEDGCVYLFELNKRYDLDGDVEWNTARLSNHSCAPNCETEHVRGHIWISALRDILEGAELSYDYGFDWENWKDHLCRCGTPSCLGYIVKKDQWKKVKKAIKAEAKEAKRKAKAERETASKGQRKQKEKKPT